MEINNERLVEELYGYCLHAFEAFYRARGKSTSRAPTELDPEYRRFVVWGCGVSVKGGELDRRLDVDRGHELRDSVLIGLGAMACNFKPGKYIPRYCFGEER